MSEPLSRQDIADTLDDIKQMWTAMADLCKSIPGAGPVLASRSELPPIIEAIFEQAASNIASETALPLNVDGDVSRCATNRLSDKQREGCKAVVADVPGHGQVNWCEPCGLYFGVGQPCPGTKGSSFGDGGSMLTDEEVTAAWNGAVEESKTKGVEMYLHLMRAIAIAQHRKAVASATKRDDVLAEVERGLHDLKNLKNAGGDRKEARGVAAAEFHVRAMRQAAPPEAEAKKT